MKFDIVLRFSDILLEGFWLTIQIAVGATILGMALGLITAVCRMGPIRPLRWVAVTYIEIIRNTPALLQIFIIYFGLANLGLRLPAFIAVIVALGINNGAYLAEIFRGGLQSVRRGQREAAAAIALPASTTFSWVVLPQAVRTIWPAMTNQTIQIILATSLAATIGMPELINQSMYLNSRYYRTNELLLTVMLMYWALTLGVSAIAGLIARRMDRPYR